jgi:hypothetical protein
MVQDGAAIEAREALVSYLERSLLLLGPVERTLTAPILKLFRAALGELTDESERQRVVEAGHAWLSRCIGFPAKLKWLETQGVDSQAINGDIENATHPTASSFDNHTAMQSAISSFDNHTAMQSAISSFDNHTAMQSAISSFDNHTAVQSAISSFDNHTAMQSAISSFDNHTAMQSEENPKEGMEGGGVAVDTMDLDEQARVSTDAMNLDEHSRGAPDVNEQHPLRDLERIFDKSNDSSAQLYGKNDAAKLD